MALAQVPDVHLEAVEETQNEGYQSKKAGRPRQTSLTNVGIPDWATGVLPEVRY